MTKQQKVKIKIDKRYKPAERKAIATEIIDLIYERTKKGLSINNKPWKGKAKKYTKGYENSLDFKNAGKIPGQPVDLEQTGEMLAEMTPLPDRAGEVNVGYKKGDEINGKVEGNRIGSYGKSANPDKARDFLGITQKDLKKILKKYPLRKGDRYINERQERVELIERASKEAGSIEDRLSLYEEYEAIE